MIFWTGVGSRIVVDDPKTEAKLRNIGLELTKRLWKLRSGGADGADEAFEDGWKMAWYYAPPQIRPQLQCEIYLPWKGFNGHASPLYTSEPNPEALYMASQIHPNWKMCSAPAKKLHARNIHQVLGQDLKTPSDVVVCWTPEGEKKGGTRTAIICAEQHGIPVVNLGGLPYSIDNDIVNTIVSMVNECKLSQHQTKNQQLLNLLDQIK
jgi:hypothetical protein